MSDTKIKIKNITELLIKAFEKEYEDSLWDTWKLQYPQMDKETFITYADYKKKSIIAQVNKGSQKSYEEIENEMDQVIKAHEAKELSKE